jgi:hypothetical protein
MSKITHQLKPAIFEKVIKQITIGQLNIIQEVILRE